MVSVRSQRVDVSRQGGIGQGPFGNVEIAVPDAADMAQGVFSLDHKRGYFIRHKTLIVVKDRRAAFRQKTKARGEIAQAPILQSTHKRDKTWLIIGPGCFSQRLRVYHLSRTSSLADGGAGCILALMLNKEIICA